MSVKLFLGNAGSGMPVVWNDADNQHIAVLGRSGSGKSYFTVGIVEQAAQQGALCVVLDYSADFISYIPPADVDFQRIDVSGPDFTLNPLAVSAARGKLAAAQQLLSALRSVFCFRPRTAVALQKATLEYLEYKTQPSLSGLLDFVENLDERSGSLDAATEPLELLSVLVHCGDRPIGIDLDRPGIIVLGFDQILDTKLRSLLVELILQTIWDRWTSVPYDPGHPLILVLDECQNLSWNEGNMAVRILREGRKFGIGGWFASQWVADKTALSALGQAAFQANFRPDDANIPVLAKRLAQSGGTTAQWQELLRRLRVGQFLFRRRDGQAVVVDVPAGKHTDSENLLG